MRKSMTQKNHFKSRRVVFHCWMCTARWPSRKPTSLVIEHCTDNTSTYQTISEYSDELLGIIDLLTVSYDSANKQKQHKKPLCKKVTNCLEIWINGNNSKRTDQCKQILSLCNIGLVKDPGGRLVNQPESTPYDKC